MNIDFCLKKIGGKWEVIKGESREIEGGGAAAIEGPNFKEVSQFLKSNRVSPAFALTSNKDQTCMKKLLCFLIVSRNMSILCHFQSLWGGGGHGRVLPPWIRL